MYLKSNDGPVSAALPVHLEYRRVRLLDLNGNDRRLDVQNVIYLKMGRRPVNNKQIELGVLQGHDIRFINNCPPLQ
jgi:hypothetical protein